MEYYTINYYQTLEHVTMCVHEHAHTHIYIYSYPQIDCFIVSQLFSVVRHIRCFKRELKDGWFYVGPISYPLAIIISA